MKKVIPVKDFVWAKRFPLFKKDESYILEDTIADQMVELGYARFTEEEVVEEEVVEEEVDTEKLQPQAENKLLDMKKTSNKNNSKKKAVKKS